MMKGLKIRFDIHKILYSIHKFNKTLNSSGIKTIINNHTSQDIAFLHNVTLNSMRLHLHASKIIGLHISNKIRDHERILLISAITQIVFLNFKEYAVINCSVEIAKKLKLYPGLINATLKKIAKNKIALSKIEIEYNDLPNWFKKRTNSLSPKDKDQFLNSFTNEPDIHIVFKNKEKFNNFNENLIKTSDVSGFIVEKGDIRNKKTFVNGEWWVQDFASFFPLHNFKYENKYKKYLDACAAPGGKSFQLLSRNINVVLNDKSISRIETLKSNLNRLKFNPKILNQNFMDLDHKEKYDVIIVDAPCSAVGTIRKNPEIFFKNNGPDFSSLNILQEKMLQKASGLLNKNGFIVYMVCSFLKIETEDQINKFLEYNDNFQLSNFFLLEENNNYTRFIKNDFMKTLPDTILDYKIDGYFAALLRKVK